MLEGKPEGKRPLGRLRLRWDDNIKMDLQEVGGGGGRGGLEGGGVGQGQGGGPGGYGEGLSGSINAGNFLTSCEVYC
jgi:hypothetical protein